MMEITVVVNQNKANAMAYAEEIASYLKEKGAGVRIMTQAHFGQEELRGSSCIISVGGDGTLLRTAGILAGEEIPVLGINVGHLGYLTEVSHREEIPEALDKLLQGQYLIDSRTMLQGSVYRGDIRIADGLVLNELVLTRREGVKVLRFQLSADGTILNEYASDGLIISTPTGSTAYNLSAGGPIVSPGAAVMILMPICAHALNGRGILLEDSRVLEILVESDNQQLAFDGEKTVALMEGDRICISRAVERTLLVKLRNESFLTTLKQKMTSV